MVIYLFFELERFYKEKKPGVIQNFNCFLRCIYKHSENKKKQPFNRVLVFYYPFYIMKVIKFKMFTMLYLKEEAICNIQKKKKYLRSLCKFNFKYTCFIRLRIFKNNNNIIFHLNLMQKNNTNSVIKRGGTKIYNLDIEIFFLKQLCRTNWIFQGIQVPCVCKGTHGIECISYNSILLKIKINIYRILYRYTNSSNEKLKKY